MQKIEKSKNIRIIPFAYCTFPENHYYYDVALIVLEEELTLSPFVSHRLHQNTLPKCPSVFRDGGSINKHLNN